MKRFIGLLLCVAVIYAIYYDFSTGTLPKDIESTDAKETSLSVHFVEVTIQPGDTLLSLIEKQENYPEHISIEQMIKDFELLNNGLKPEHMLIGQTYKIPLYENTAAE